MPPKTMAQLERETQQEYAHASSLHREIISVERTANQLRLFFLIALPFLIFFVIACFTFASWYIALAPFLCLGLLTGYVTQLSHGFRAVQLPALRCQYHRALTQATDALQRQEERRVLELLDAEAYATIEREAQEAEDVSKQSLQMRYEKRLAKRRWQEAFNKSLKNADSVTSYREDDHIC